MRRLRGWIIRLGGLFNRRRRDREMDQEFETHLQMQIEDNLRSGMTAEEARRAALIKAGGLSSARETYRQQRGLPFFETLLQDLRYGARNLRQSPGFTSVAILTLALGIGANTAMFSVINAVLLRPLPYRNPDRLVQLWETEPAPGTFPFAGPDYLDWQAQNRTLESSSLFTTTTFNLSRGSDSEGARAAKTQANLFSTLGVPVIRGRSFAPGEDQEGKNHVVLLSYSLWQSFFGGRDDAINTTVALDGEKYTVVGVLPSSFQLRSASLYVPLDMAPKKLGGRGNHSYWALARLKPGITREAAQADLGAIAKRLEEQYPDSNNKVGAVVVDLREQTTGYVRKPLIVLLGAVALVLLVACANLANMLLARSTTRQREIALRMVLGASHARVVRQLLTESLLLSLSGAALGLTGAWWCVGLIRAAKALPLPLQATVQIDVNVLLFTLGAAIAVTLLFGVAPALQATQFKLGEELKTAAQPVVSANPWTRVLRDALVISEVALCLSLLAGAGLLLKSFNKMRNSDIGIDPENVTTFRVVLPASNYPDENSQRRFSEQLLSRLETLPGAKAAAFSTAIPLDGGSNGTIQVPGDTDPSHGSILVEHNFITPEYFRTYGIALIEGANFSTADMEHASDVSLKLEEFFKKNPDAKKIPPALGFEAVISKAMADTFWPSQNPVGRTYAWGPVPLKVIGVVADVKEWGVRQPAIPQAYYPLMLAFSSKGGFGSFVSVKTTADPSNTLAGIRNALRSLDSSLALFQPRTMQQVIDNDVHDAGISTFLLGSFAGLALLLAAIGIYSVISYLVTQRTREIGIRMALGAQRGDVFSLVLRHAVLLTGVGLACGVALALAASRLLKSMLYGVTGHDPLTFAAVVVLLAIIAMVACLVPLRRAMRVDPMVALRYE